MADNVTVHNGATGDGTEFDVVTDEVTSPYTGGTKHAQGVKILDGTADGTTPAEVTSTGELKVEGKPQQGSLTDGSGDIVAGSTSEEVFAANTSRVFLLVQNVSDTNMWVNFGTAAVEDQPSVFLAADGGSIVFADSFVPTGTVNIICASSGKAYVAKQA